MTPSPVRGLALLLSLLLIVSAATLHAQVPQLLNYQGRVAVGDPPVNFDGKGKFKFALVDGTGATSYWSNDGTSTAGSEPAAAVTVTVTKGLYSVLLGEKMTAIPNSVFGNSDVRLRVWFDDGTANGSQRLSPDQRFAAVGYAMVAGGLPGVTADGGRIGIGTGNPSTKLEVAGTVTATAFTSTSAESPETVFPAQGMVWIKPGKFLMGSRTDEPERESDETQHWVTLTRGFWMGVHEVTQAEYVAVTGLANPSTFLGDANHPVESVSWTSAVAYCTMLTTTERAANRIPADWEYRLPTEAEWEYCSRAGARTTRFGYGDDLGGTAMGEYAWYWPGSGLLTTRPVEQKRGNAWGLMDMHGNVTELCQDWYGAYPAGSVTDPQGPEAGSVRVARGGNYAGNAVHLRCARRFSRDPSLTAQNFGFRVALAPVQP